VKPRAKHPATDKPPTYWNKAALALSNRDPIMAALIARYPDAILANRGDPFQTLLRAIVGQQISVKAADSIWARFATLAELINPQRIADLDPTALAACGFSRRKVEYVQDLAGHFLDGRIDPERWTYEADEIVIAELIDVRGIGRWTAEMFLIFFLMRPDVLPLDDIGLQNAVSRLYYNGKPRTRQQLIKFAKRWEPWRSVATWYMWRSLDPVPVEY
jgi:DNA-3-methyladenine glycosylase II